MSLAKTPSRALLIAGIVLLCVVWGSTWVVIAGGLDDLQPFTAAAVRFVVAALAMQVLGPFLARKEGGEAPGWSLVLTVGCLNFGASYGIVYWSEQYLPSSLVAVVWSAFPLMMGVLGHLFLEGERLRPIQWLGLLAGFAGVALLFATDLRTNESSLKAGAILLLSPLACAIGTVRLKHAGAGISSVLLNRGAMGVGAILLCLMALVTEGDAVNNWTPQAVGSVVYLALVGTVLTFGLYFWAMRYAPAYQLSLIAYVTPGIALLLGAGLRNEAIGAGTLGGLAVILAGVAAVFAGRQRDAPQSDS
ncbi:MAG: drug/metabolite transporter (DMT)-like permease [Planctomycetota bacterium]